MNCSNKLEYSLIWFYDNVGSCISIFLAVSKTLAARSSKKLSGAYMVSARFGKQHIDLVNPMIEYTSFFITGGLTNARNRRFYLHLMNSEDQLFLHNRLRAIVSTLDDGPPCHTQNPRINNNCCDQQQQRGFLGQWIKISLKCGLIEV